MTKRVTNPAHRICERCPHNRKDHLGGPADAKGQLLKCMEPGCRCPGWKWTDPTAADPLVVWQSIPSGTQRLVLGALRMESDKQMNVLPFREAADALEALISGESWS